MGGSAEASPIAILAGSGKLPQLVTAAALRSGRNPVVFAIVGEAEPESFAPAPVYTVRWGEVGRLFRMTAEKGCREAVFIGSIRRRPDYRTLLPDFGTIKLIPRILRLMAGRDNALLTGVAKIFEEHGLRLVSPLAVAPDLALGEGCQVGVVSPQSEADIEAAAEAAHKVGSLDIAQGAVAVGGRVVAEEDASGTDALLDRVALLRRAGTINNEGGVLVKCLKPKQDGLHDLPTVGPSTAEHAKNAGLAGVAAEAGRTMLVGRDETIDAFRHAGLFLLGLKAPKPEHG